MSSSERPAVAPVASAATPARARRGDAPPRRAAVAGLVCGLVLAAGITGCGFRLRGDVTYAFSTLYVSGPPSAPIVVELTRTLENGGETRLAKAPAEAQEQRMLREMQTDAVQQIVRRLQAAKKPVS